MEGDTVMIQCLQVSLKVLSQTLKTLSCDDIWHFQKVTHHNMISKHYIQPLSSETPQIHGLGNTKRRNSHLSSTTYDLLLPTTCKLLNNEWSIKSLMNRLLLEPLKSGCGLRGLGSRALSCMDSLWGTPCIPYFFNANSRLYTNQFDWALFL